MMEFHDVKQNGPEWDSFRCGRFTASNLASVMANSIKKDKGKLIFDATAGFGEVAKDYAVDIAIEQLTDKPVPQYSNNFMDSGHEKEEDAKLLYESQNFIKLHNGGFFCNEFIGCSPDGLFDFSKKDKRYKGIAEIKSVIKKARTHFERIKKGVIPSENKWQCIGNLKWTGADYLDFISYCWWYPEGKKLYILRVFKEDFLQEFDWIEKRVERFKKLVEESKEIISNAKYQNF